jgi:hypothetical protein
MNPDSDLEYRNIGFLIRDHDYGLDPVPTPT